MNDTVIIIPTYNEAANIVTLLDRIWKLPLEADVMVIDDNSPDGTAETVRRLAGDRGRTDELTLVERPGKLGLGTAYILGFKQALQRGYARIVQMDADLSHDPDYLPLFLEALHTCDFVIGSRYWKWRLSVVNWSLHRLLISLLGQLYLKMVMNDCRIYDFTSGYKAFNRKVLEAIDIEDIRSTGYCFQVDVNFRACMKGFSLRELPIVFHDRTAEVSKMSGNIILEALIQPLILRLRWFLNHCRTKKVPINRS
jgi:dolichol-phosphate mannosyltransferase